MWIGPKKRGRRLSGEAAEIPNEVGLIVVSSLHGNLRPASRFRAAQQAKGPPKPDDPLKRLRCQPYFLLKPPLQGPHRHSSPGRQLTDGTLISGRNRPDGDRHGRIDRGAKESGQGNHDLLPALPMAARRRCRTLQRQGQPGVYVVE